MRSSRKEFRLPPSKLILYLDAFSVVELINLKHAFIRYHSENCKEEERSRLYFSILNSRKINVEKEEGKMCPLDKININSLFNEYPFLLDEVFQIVQDEILNFFSDKKKDLPL